MLQDDEMFCTAIIYVVYSMAGRRDGLHLSRTRPLMLHNSSRGVKWFDEKAHPPNLEHALKMPPTTAVVAICRVGPTHKAGACCIPEGLLSRPTKVETDAVCVRLFTETRIRAT